LKPARANSPQDPISKKLITKKGWWSGSRFKPQSPKKEEGKKRILTNIKLTLKHRNRCSVSLIRKMQIKTVPRQSFHSSDWQKF
jgi:hypothetical protein